METTLPDNILSKVSRVRLVRDIAQKSGKPYYRLEVQFINDYTFKAFTNDEQTSLIKYAINTKLDTNPDPLNLNE